MFTLRIWVIKSGVLKILLILSQHYTKANIRSTQMANTRHAYKAIRRQMDYHYTVVSRLVRKHTQTKHVKDLPRSGRPRVIYDRDDRALQRLVRWKPFVVPYSNNTDCPIDVCQQEQFETV